MLTETRGILNTLVARVLDTDIAEAPDRASAFKQEFGLKTL